MEPVSRLLIIAGLVLVVAGLLVHVAPSIPLLGRLPGDIRIERPGLRLYVPLVSCLVVSVVLSAVLWLISKLR